MQPSGDGRVPVFVFPNSITFYLEDQTTHKQILTLYNPYDFAVRFKVLSTSPRKYTVVDPEGSIRPKCCIDIVIRHTAVNQVNCQIVDKFRIQMYDFSTNKMIGRRDVTASLVSGEPDRSTPDKEFESLAPPPSPHSQPQRQYSLGHRSERPTSAGPNQWFLSAVALVCIAVLCLPLEGEKSAISWPVTVNVKLVVSYVLASNNRSNGSDTNFVALSTAVVCIAGLLLPTEGDESSVAIKMSVNMKLAFSYVLGLVTMVIFRPA